METDFSLNDQEKKQLLEIARSTIVSYIKDNKKPKLDTTPYSKTLKAHCGAFVTLHKSGRLRGCIGRFTSNEPLYLIVQQMAIASACNDTRFDEVTEKEIDELDIEISVLTPMRLIENIDEIELGKHGIYIKKGYAAGTFLPQVATETGWTKEQFLGHCSRDKAGLGWEGWQDADIYIYEANVFGEQDFEKE